ncbi:MAG: hypothetical protein ACKESB_00135 [Candidatus Hodgkinia cicadicola]
MSGGWPNRGSEVEEIAGEGKGMVDVWGWRDGCGCMGGLRRWSARRGKKRVSVGGGGRRKHTRCPAVYASSAEAAVRTILSSQPLCSSLNSFEPLVLPFIRYMFQSANLFSLSTAACLRLLEGSGRRRRRKKGASGTRWHTYPVINYSTKQALSLATRCHSPSALTVKLSIPEANRVPLHTLN